MPSQPSHARCQTWFEEESRPIETLGFCQGTVVGCSFKSPHKESRNEDAAALVELSPGHGILAVADGVGGQNAGDRAARTVIEAIVNHCTAVNEEGSLRPQLLDAIEGANHEILTWGIGAGATVVVAEYRDGHLRIIHVGDASAILCSNRGRLKFFTVAHGPVAMAVEIGVLNEQEAMVHEDRNIISNCVGSTEMKIEIGPRVAMAAYDTLVLASDGLFDNLTNEEIVARIRSGKLDRRAHEMIDLARTRMLAADGTSGKPDDLTVLCFRQTPAQ